MKSVHGKFAPQEETNSLPHIGNPFRGNVKYTKDDFLTPGAVAKKFEISTEKARELMKKMKKLNTSFVLNGHMATAIVNFNKGGCVYLHPMAMDVFQQQLNKQKG